MPCQHAYRYVFALLVVIVGFAGCVRSTLPPAPERSPADAAFERGVAALTSSAYDQAIADFTQAITLNPQRVEAYHNRGEAYRRKGDYDRALADYSQALTVNPAYAPAYYNRGIVYSNKGDYERALADYTQALTLNPQFTVAYIHRGIAYDTGKPAYDR